MSILQKINDNPMIMAIVALAIGILVSVAYVLNPVGIYTVPEGFETISYTLGSLNKETYKSDGMLHFYCRLITLISNVETREQVDNVDATGVSRDGVKFEFNIEVSNQLIDVYGTVKRYKENYDQIVIFKRVRTELQEWCNTKTADEIHKANYGQVALIIKAGLQKYNDELKTGILIHGVYMKRPIGPRELEMQYEKTAQQNVALQTAQAEQNRVKLETQTEAIRVNATNENLISTKRAEQARQMIDIETATAKSKSETDARQYQAESEAQSKANYYAKVLAIPGVQQLEYAERMSRNTKYYFGPDIPQYLTVEKGDKVD